MHAYSGQEPAQQFIEIYKIRTTLATIFDSYWKEFSIYMCVGTKLAFVADTFQPV